MKSYRVWDDGGGGRELHRDLRSNPFQVLIVEDHDAMREMLIEMIRRMTGFVVCAAVVSGEEALDGLDSICAEADVALIDMSLPHMSGAELVVAIRESAPAIRCLMLSGHRESQYVRRALAAGARGYVLKGDPYQIETALRRVVQGELYLTPGLRQA